MLILLGSLVTREQDFPISGDTEYSGLSSLLLFSHLRPRKLPDFQWHGANKVLPMLQFPRPIKHLLDESAWRVLETLLRKEWLGTNEATLSDVFCDKLLSESGIHHLECRETLQDMYTRVQKQDQPHEPSRFVTMWYATIQQAKARSLAKGPINGLYELERGGLDWARIVNIAKNAAEAHGQRIPTKGSVSRFSYGAISAIR